MKSSGVITSILLAMLTLLTVILGSYIPTQFKFFEPVWFIIPMTIGILALYSLFS